MADMMRRFVPVFAFFKPLDDFGSKFLLRLTADIDTDMAGIEAYIFGVLASHHTGDLFSSSGGHKMVVLAINIEKRHGDILQIHPLAADHELVLNEQISLVAVLDELSEGLARYIRAVENPFFHADKVFDKCLVVHVLHETHVFVDHQSCRIEEQKSEIHEVPGHVPEGVDHLVRIHRISSRHAAGPGRCRNWSG